MQRQNVEERCKNVWSQESGGRCVLEAVLGWLSAPNCCLEEKQGHLAAEPLVLGVLH